MIIAPVRNIKELPTYLFPKRTLTLTSHLRQNVGLGERWVDSFPETCNDPKVVRFNKELTLSTVSFGSLSSSSFCVLVEITLAII